MKKFVILNLVLFCLSLQSIAQTTYTHNLQKQSFKAGGVNFTIPLPDPAFVEISNDHRGLVELFVPQSNRLICAFALKNEIADLLKDGNMNSMTRYALIEVPRIGEYEEFESSEFNEVVNELKEAFGNASSIMQQGEDEFNSRMESLDLSNMKVKLGQPTMLGSFFSEKDVYASGMLMGVEMDNEIYKMGASIILLRVKKRLLFIYLYAEYENDESIKWLRNISEKWSDEIISANNINNTNIVSK